jgi:hypothetical protein
VAGWPRWPRWRLVTHSQGTTAGVSETRVRLSRAELAPRSPLDRHSALLSSARNTLDSQSSSNEPCPGSHAANDYYTGSANKTHRQAVSCTAVIGVQRSVLQHRIFSCRWCTLRTLREPLNGYIYHSNQRNLTGRQQALPATWRWSILYKVRSLGSRHAGCLVARWPLHESGMNPVSPLMNEFHMARVHIVAPASLDDTSAYCTIYCVRRPFDGRICTAIYCRLMYRADIQHLLLRR